jgi:Flp pilus assembly protein TadD
LYRQRGEHTRCLTTLHHLLDTYPEGEEPRLALQMEGLTLADLGRPEQAVESLTAATHRGPPSAEAYYQLAQVLETAGRPADATAAAQQALVADASHMPSRELLARLAATPAPNSQPVR